MKKIILLIVIFFYLFTKYVVAFSFFDEFNSSSLDFSKWVVFSDPNKTYSLTSGYLEIPKNGNLDENFFPLVFTKEYLNLDNFDFELYFQYKSVQDHGLGLFMAYTKHDFTNFMTDYLQYPIFQIWQEKAGGLRTVIYTEKCFEWGITCPASYKSNFGLNNKNYYKLVMTKRNLDIQYKIFSQTNSLIYNSPVFQLNQGMKANTLMIGHPYFSFFTDPKKWSQIKLDYIHIDSFKTPVVFLPGYTASFNWEDMRDNTSSHVWERNPFEKVYDNFFLTLENLGYVKNKDYFRFDYDFRRSLSESADKLKIFIDQKAAEFPQGTKFLLVGHSFGGLLARKYWQANFNNNLIEKVITIGSPHKGAVEAYAMLAGGDSLERNIFKKAAFETIFLWHDKNHWTRIETIKDILPSMSELLPTFSFLKDEVNQPIVSSLINPTLPTLNSEFASEFNKFSPLIQTIVGDGIETRRRFVLTPASFAEKAIGMWPDGKISITENSMEGDGTVLALSGNVENITPLTVSNTNHEELMTTHEGIDKILTAMDLTHESQDIVSSSLSFYDRAILFLLKSPATISITDPQTGESFGGTVSTDNEQMVLVPLSAPGNVNFDVTVTGTDFGQWELEIAALSNMIDTTRLVLRGQTDNSQVDVFQVSLSPLNQIQLIDPLLADNETVLQAQFENLKNYLTENSNQISLWQNEISWITNHQNEKEKCLKLLLEQIKEIFDLDINTAEIKNRVNEILVNLEPVFVALQKGTGHYPASKVNYYLEDLNQISTSVETQLEKKTSSSDAWALFILGKEWQNKAHQDLTQNLIAEAFFSATISRLWAIEALNL